MKQLLTVVLFSCIIGLSSLEAQTKATPDVIGISLLGIDHNGDGSIFSDSDFWTYGMQVSYGTHLAGNFNLMIPLRIGTIAYKDANINSQRNNLNEEGFLSLGTQAKLNLDESGKFIPYVFAGFNIIWDFSQNPTRLEFPLGIGVDLNLGGGTTVGYQLEYGQDVSERSADNIMHSLGMKFPLKVTEEVVEEVMPVPTDIDGDGVLDKDDACPETPGLAALSGCPDADGDGIADGDDDCPEVAGIAALNGCPDRDGDGITDADDKCPDDAGPRNLDGCPDGDGDGVADVDDECPTVPGLVSRAGCPNPDRDGDGVIDDDDKCPDTPGTRALDGCPPPPDRDGDGVADADDRCPDEAGPADNKGCPEIDIVTQKRLNYAAQNVQFETGSSRLTSSSLTILDEVAEIAQQYPNYNMSISGHTDSTGGEALNQSLSEKRAQACYDYLVSKGVSASRMSHTGYGELQPIADNNTREGRKLNRRVVFNMFVR